MDRLHENETPEDQAAITHTITDYLAQPKRYHPDFRENRRSVYWIDHHPPHAGPDGFTIVTSNPRICTLANPKPLHPEYMPDKRVIWECDREKYSNYQPTTRIQHLSQSKIAHPQHEFDRSATTTVSTAAAKHRASHGTYNSTNPSSYKKCACAHRETIRRCAIGSALMLGIGTSWVALTQFAKACYHGNYNFQAPFVITYLSSSTMILFFPVYIVVKFACTLGESTPAAIFRDSVKVFSKEQFNFRSFTAKTIVFCLMWTSSNYLYMRALVILSVTDITALFSTNHAFVYMLSWIALFEKFVALRIVAMIFSITGIVLFAYVGSDASLDKTNMLGVILTIGSAAGAAVYKFAYVGSDASLDKTNMLGVILTIGSAAGAAVYKVLFKKYVGEANYGQVTLFLTTVGLSVILLTWPILLLLYFTGVEPVDWSRLPWQYLCVTVSLTLAYQFMVNLAVTASYPIFTGLGVVVAIPLAVCSDIIWHSPTFPGMKTAGIVLITIGLIIVLQPDNLFDSMATVFSHRHHEDVPPSPPRRRSRFASVTISVQSGTT